MFQRRHASSARQQGRLAIPAKHREALLARADGHMVLTADPSRCLLLYPFPEWEPIQKRLMALSSFNDKIRGAAASARRSRRRRRARWRRPHSGPTGAAPIRDARQTRRAGRARQQVRALGRGAVAGPDRASRRVSGRRPAARARRLFALMPHGDHVPVLLEEAVAALAVKPEGIYLDGTFGRGGHACAFSMRWGRMAGSSPSTAIHPRRRWRASGPTRAFTFIVHGFRRWPTCSRASISTASTARCWTSGIASPQIDQPERGFSFRADGPLDMRMDPSRGSSAAQWLASASEAELKGVIADYGEERFAQQIARAIVAARAHEPITRTRQLAAIVAKAVGARARGDRSQDPATRTFQAVRIYVNQELQELSLALDARPAMPCHRRPLGRDQLSLARGPAGEAVFSPP